MDKEICVLKNFRNILDATTDTDCTDLDNAIKTIEYAMKPKTCDGCIRLYFDEIEKVYKCWNDVSDDVGYLHGEAVIRNIKDFCCNQFQPKDN